MLHIDDFEFLAWMREVIFFPDDLLAQLERLGMGAAEAFLISRSDAVRRADIVMLYHDSFRHQPEMFERLLADCYEQHARAVAHIRKVLPDRSS